MKLKKSLAMLMSAALTLSMVTPMVLPQTVWADGTDSIQTGGGTSTVKATAVDPKTAADDVYYTDSSGNATTVLQTAYVSTMAELQSAITASGTVSAAQETTIYVTKDITLTYSAYTPISITGKYIHLESYGSDEDGNPWEIKAENNYTPVYGSTNGQDFMFKLGTSAKVVLENITINADHSRKCFYNVSSELDINDGTSIINGGGTQSIGGSSALYSGGAGVTVAGTGKCIMNGGSISGCYSIYTNDAQIRGKAVYVGGTSSSFIMYGGSITENNDTFSSDATSYRGSLGAVYNIGTFDMEGGEISDNSSMLVGGIYNEKGTLVIGSGAKIDGNTSTSIYDGTDVADKITGTVNSTANAGGIYMYAGSLQIKDGAKIYENTVSSSKDANQQASGGGIHVVSGTVTMSGGSIYNNTAKSTATASTTAVGNGGGIYLEGGSMEMTGGSIYGNSAATDTSSNALSGNGGGVCVGATSASSVGTFTMHGGSIAPNGDSDNTAANKGNGLYLLSSISGASVAPKLVLGGTPTLDGAYLPSAAADASDKSAVLTVDERLKTGSAISFDTDNADVGTVLAQAGTGYTLANLDAARFTYSGSVGSRKVALSQTDSASYLTMAEATDDTGKTSIADATATVADVTYTGSEVQPSVEVKLGDTTLKEGTDYELECDDNINAGQASVLINGIGNYKDYLEKSFTIIPADLSSDSLPETLQVSGLDSNTYYYSGKAITPTLAVSYGSKLLTEGTDYSITYSDNDAVGTASVTIAGMGNFSNSKTETFAIIAVPDGSVLVSDEASLRQAIADIGTSDTKSGRIILDSDISLTNGSLSVPAASSVQIFGNGHKLTAGAENYAASGSEDTAMFIVPSDGSLQLSTVTLDGQYKERLIHVAAGGICTIDSDVVLTEGQATSAVQEDAALGGQCIWNAGTVSFSGTIDTDKTTALENGTVYNKGTFTMKDGSTITNVTTYNYGAVLNDTDGTFDMEGGTISNCATLYMTDNEKAIRNLGTCNIFGGTITGNDGFGKCISNLGEMNILGGSIEKNIMTNGLYGTCYCGTIYAGAGTLNVNGGTITENRTYAYGGAIQINGGTVNVNDGADITKNLALNLVTNSSQGVDTSNGGAIYMTKGTLNVNGGQITGNEAYLHMSLTDSTTSVTSEYDLAYDYNVTATSGISGGQKIYGTGGAIWACGGTINISGGNISGNKTPGNIVTTGNTMSGITTSGTMDRTSGIYLTGTSYSSTIPVLNISGDPVISDNIYLNTGESVNLAGHLGDDADLTVYQQQSDFRMMESGGTPVAKFTNLDLSALDGDALAAELKARNADAEKFNIYKYASTDYAADPLLTKYVNELNEAGDDSAIYATMEFALSDLTYTFTDKDSEVADADGNKVASYEYTGKSITPSIEASYSYQETDENGNPVVDEDQNPVMVTKTFSSAELDYAIESSDSTDAGTVSVKVSSDSSIFNGTKTLTYQITPIDISMARRINGVATNIDTDSEKFLETNVSVGNVTYYTGESIPDPDVTVTVKKSGALEATTLQKGTDYTVSYSDNTAAGKAKATVTGTGNYTGTLPVQTYTITENTDKVKAKSVTAKITALPSDSKITMADKSAVVAARTAYDALTTSQKAFVTAATLKKLTDAEAMIKQLTDVNSITPSDTAADRAAESKSISKVAASGITATASKSAKTMTVSFKAVSGAKNYRIAYRLAGASTWSYKWSAGKTSAVIKGMKANGLYQFKVTAYKKSGTTWTRGAWSAVNYRYFNSTAAKATITAGSKSVKAKITKVSGADGYQLLASTAKAMTSPKTKTASGASSKTVTLKGLTKGKKYYVQVRVYKTKSGTKYAGLFAASKTVKVK